MTYRKAGLLVFIALALACSVGKANAEAKDRDVVRDKEGQIVHSSNGACVRTKWDDGRDACASRRIAEQKIVPRADIEPKKTRPVVEFTREERTIYFDFDRFALLPQSSDRLRALANALKADQTVKEARIVGYADRIGTVSYNKRLSQKRAEVVRDYLISAGYTHAQITKTRWVGKTEPSTNCPSGKSRLNLIACLQDDRRVEVEISLQRNVETTVNQ